MIIDIYVIYMYDSFTKLVPSASCGRRGGVVVSALVLCSSPGRGHCFVLLAKGTYLLQCLSTKAYKWVPAKCMVGVTLPMD